MFVYIYLLGATIDNLESLFVFNNAKAKLINMKNSKKMNFKRGSFFMENKVFDDKTKCDIIFVWCENLLFIYCLCMYEIEIFAILTKWRFCLTMFA